MPGDVSTDFAGVLAGLVGASEAGTGEPPVNVPPPPQEAGADGASECPAEGITDGAGPVPEMPSCAPATPPPLTLPDILARMVPPPSIPATSEPIPAESGAVQGGTGQGAMNPLGLPTSAAPSPIMPAMPDGLPPDAAMPAGSRLDPPATTEATQAPDSQLDTPRPLPATAPAHSSATPAELPVSAPTATMTEPPPALPDPTGLGPAEAIAAPPDTPPSATGGASAVQLAAPAPEAPAAPSRPTAPIPWPARQVVPFAVSLALGSDDILNLTLDPIELGRVEVAIARGTDAHVSLRAERPETLALLQRDRAELERALAGTGFGTEGRAPSLSFSLGFGGKGEDRRDRRPAARDGQGARPPIHGPVPAIQHAAPTARGLIDLAF